MTENAHPRTPAYRPVLDEMVAVAREAGRLTQRYFEDRLALAVGMKGPSDFVSRADEEAEVLIRTSLLARHPDWGFVGEEFPSAAGRDPDHVWLVDPIDGTTNFLAGMPYTISIALRHRDETVCGALYNPVADEMFTVIRGEGAFLNGRRMTVSALTDHRRFVVGTGIPTSNLAFHEGYYGRLEAVREPIGAVRILGSCANSLAHVACGRLDGYFEGPTGLIDFAVGVLLVQEAGGIVTDFWGRGAEHWERNATLVAGSAAAHAFLLERTRATPRSDS